MTARTAQEPVAARERSDAPFGVRARGVTKSFGRTHAVRGVSFELPSHGVCGILGPNGAGKTTTIRMVAGVLVPDSGDLEGAGLDVRRRGTEVRAAVGYLPESAPLYPELTVDEYMSFRAGLAGMPR
ncbi:MAG: ATP-binding cassette domain-containing protein, partial [Phycisphaerales bacterium]